MPRFGRRCDAGYLFTRIRDADGKLSDSSQARPAAGFQGVVVAPQCRGDCRWVEVDWSLEAHGMPAEGSRPMRLLFGLLPVIEKESAIDPSRRSVAGLSMGGSDKHP